MYRKIIVVALFAFFLPIACQAKSTGYRATKANAGWILLAADAVFTGAAVWAVMDQNASATDYEKLRLQIDDTTESNYYRLLYEQEKVASKENVALIACVSAGALLTYTLADLFFLRAAFPEVHAKIDPARGGVTLAYVKEF